MTTQPFRTNNKLGLPLETPSTQTVLPVICGGNGNLMGYFAIAQTTFNGSETEFTLSEGDVDITTYTLPKLLESTMYLTGRHVNQFMAVVYDDDDQSKKPWLGYSAFVSNDDTGYLGAQHHMPTTGMFTNYYLGILVGNLAVNMSSNLPNPVPPSPPTVTTPQTIKWFASLATDSTQLQCGFFDFAWTTLFNAHSTNHGMKIEIVSNPPGGYFKATFVPNPVIVGQGEVQFNTIRIIRLQPPPAGSYVFQFKVTDDKGLSTNCQLTVQVV